MKALDKFENTDKLRLLHDLFPQEMPQVLNDILAFCEDFKNNIDEYRKSWNSGFMTVDYWLSLSIETEKLIKQYKFDMLKSRKVFADQLSYIYTVLFVNDRILKYGENRCRNEKFKLAVTILFT